MNWDVEGLFDAHAAPTSPLRRGPTLRIAAPKALAWKSLLLLATTVAFVPLLLWQHAWAAGVYVAALVAVHVAGLVILVAGSGPWWKDRRGLAWRGAAIVLLAVLLAMAGQGLTGTTGPWFWATLGVVWLLHTAGALVFHLRGEAKACPFV